MHVLRSRPSHTGANGQSTTSSPFETRNGTFDGNNNNNNSSNNQADDNRHSIPIKSGSNNKIPDGGSSAAAFTTIHNRSTTPPRNSIAGEEDPCDLLLPPPPLCKKTGCAVHDGLDSSGRGSKNIKNGHGLWSSFCWFCCYCCCSLTNRWSLMFNKSAVRPKRSRFLFAVNARVVIAFCTIILLMVWYWAWIFVTGTRTGSYLPNDASLEARLQDSLEEFPNDRITVVLMNHYRSRMIRESSLLPTLLNHPAVESIFLCHSNAATKFHYHHAKVVNVDAVAANQIMGLALRFWFCAKANDIGSASTYVMHVDDDQEMSRDAITTMFLYSLYESNNGIVGHFGRAYRPWIAQSRNGYDTRTIFGPVQVVLTKVMIMPQRLCVEFFKHAHLVQDLVDHESKPLWNGEDIFMSLVANHVNANPSAISMNESSYRPQVRTATSLDQQWNNFAIRNIDVWEASDTFKDDDTGRNDVSGNMDRHRWWNVGWTAWQQARQRAQKHTAYRGTLWNRAVQRMSEPHQDRDDAMAYYQGRLDQISGSAINQASASKVT